VSFHYEIVFALDLRDGTPADVLDELRWHLGLPGDLPASTRLPVAYRLLRPSGQTHLPGGESVRLDRYLKFYGHFAIGLFARLFWLDDIWAESWFDVVEFLSPHVESEGYAGFYREEFDLIPHLLIYRKGMPYLLEPNGVPQPIHEEGIPWEISPPS
jgi:hypothetical protein